MEESLFFGLDGPLDAAPASGQMRAANFCGFAAYARQRGGDPRRILERHGLDPRGIADPDSHIACQKVVDVFEYCSTLFDDPLFGLHLADLQDPDVFGCVTALCRAAPDFRTGVGCLVDYIPIVHSPEAALELVEGTEAAELRWHVKADLGVNDQANYQALLLNLKLLRMMGGAGFKPSYVSLSVYAHPMDLPEIENVSACRVRAPAGVNAIGFPAAALDQPIASANRLLFRLLGGYLEEVRRADRATIVDRAEGYVRGALSSGACSVERCAQKLGMSVRTLQARLAERGARFSDLVDDQRLRFAKECLLRGEMALDEIAERLGYAEQTSFGRAFKRWTGTTPQRFRRDFAASL